MTIIKGTREQAELNAALTITSSLKNILSKKRLCVLAVPGGTSVPSIFDHLVAQDLPWDRIHLFLVDERLVSLKHKDSNSHVLKPFYKVMNEENIHLFNYKYKRCNYLTLFSGNAIFYGITRFFIFKRKNIS